MINHFDWWRILPVLPVLAALVIGLIEFWSARENKGRLHLWGVTALSVVAFVITCILMWNDQVEAAKSRSEDNKWKSWVGAKMGDEEMTQNYVNIVRELSQELIREKTGTVIDRHFASEAEREKRRTEVEQLNARSLSGYKARFQPLYDIVVAKFDYWIDGVKKHGIDVDMKINEAAAAVVITEDRNASFTVRTATFGNGDELWLQFVPAIVEDGRIVRNSHFQMPFLKRGASTGEVWAMTVEDKEYRVSNQKPTKFNYKPYQGNADKPMEDINLISAINDSLDEVMSYVVDEAKLRK